MGLCARAPRNAHLDKAVAQAQRSQQVQRSACGRTHIRTMPAVTAAALQGAWVAAAPICSSGGSGPVAPASLKAHQLQAALGTNPLLPSNIRGRP